MATLPRQTWAVQDAGKAKSWYRENVYDAGKSTTIKMLCGIPTPTSGRVEVNGITPHDDRMIATFGNYPFSIMPLAARAVLTYVLPAAMLTGRVASAGVPGWLAYTSPAAGPLLYVLAR